MANPRAFAWTTSMSSVKATCAACSLRMLLIAIKTARVAFGRAIQRSGEIAAMPIRGKLRHQYARI